MLCILSDSKIRKEQRQDAIDERINVELEQTIAWWKQADMGDIDLVRRTIDHQASLSQPDEVLMRFARLGFLSTMRTAHDLE